MKRIVYRENRLKDELARLNETRNGISCLRTHTGILSGIAVVLIASLVFFTSLKSMSKGSADTGNDSTAESSTAVSTANTARNDTTQTGSTTDSGSYAEDTPYTQSPAEKAQVQINENILRSVKPSILLKTTECAYSYSDTGHKLSFSYENGKIQADFPSEWASYIAPGTFKGGGCCVTPNKTAAVCFRNNTIVVVYSNDRGKTWNTSVPLTPSQIPTWEGGCYDSIPSGGMNAAVDFPTRDCGYFIICGGLACGSEYDHDVFKTADGGKTWSYVKSNLDDLNCVTDMHFTDSKTGYICSSAENTFDTKIIRTADGGVTWTACELPFTTNHEADKSNFEAYEKYGSPVVFAPYFIGSKGYVLAYCYENRATSATFLYCATSDSGRTWSYAAAKQSTSSPPYWKLYP